MGTFCDIGAWPYLMKCPYLANLCEIGPYLAKFREIGAVCKIGVAGGP